MDFLPIRRVLQLTCSPETEREEDGEGGDDDVGDLPDRAREDCCLRWDARFCAESAEYLDRSFTRN